MLFGELFIRPWELAKMTFREVILAIDGLRNRDEMMEGWIRRATLIIASSSIGGKEISRRFDKLWPTKRGPLKVEEKALEQLRKFRENAAMKRAKDKLDGGGA
jgi:hypothetical protein